MFRSASSARTVGSAGEPRERAGPPQERVQDLAGRPLVGEVGQIPQVADEPRDRFPGRRGDAEDARLPLELLEDLPQRPVATAGAGHDRGQVRAAEARTARPWPRA